MHAPCPPDRVFLTPAQHAPGYGIAQAIKIKSIESTKGMLRLRFIAGGRVFAAMGRYLAEEAALNKVN